MGSGFSGTELEEGSGFSDKEPKRGYGFSRIRNPHKNSAKSE
jgi:hypothetical protein